MHYKFIMDERTWAVVDLDKLRENITNIRKQLLSVNPKTKILAVVKADAYGHGAVEISEVLKDEKINCLGVASIDEACDLEQINLPTVILSPTSGNNIPIIVEKEFIPTVSSYNFAKELNKLARKRKKNIKIYVEIDTGMIRTGVLWGKSIDFISKIADFRNLKTEGIFTHFSEADDLTSNFTKLQLERFNSVLDGLKKKRIIK